MAKAAVQKQKKKHRLYIIVGCILLLLIIVRLLLPMIVLKYANKSLASIDGYFGHVNDINIDLYRGAYQLDSIYINKVDPKSGKQIQFFDSHKVDLSIEWHALFDGRIVGKIKFYSPQLIFTKGKTEIGQVAHDTDDFRKILRDFMPLKVNRFETFNGAIHYVDETTTPKVDISLKNTHIIATNLKNTSDKKEKLPSDVSATANAYEGTLSLHMKVDGMAKTPTFELSAEIKNANLVLLNDFFKAYGKFDISRGSLGLYTEFAAENGKFKGYVKPIIKDLKVLGPKDKNDGFLQKTKEAIIGLAGKILTNPKEKQVATKIPIEGTFGNSSIDNLEAIWELLRNAFIQALTPSVDNEISIQSLENSQVDKPEKKGLLKRIFSPHKKKKDKKSNLEKYNTPDK